MLKNNQIFQPYVRQILIIFFVGLNILTLGLGSVWTSPMLVKLSNATHPVLYRRITSEEGSWIVSIPFISGIFSIAIAGYLVNLSGRKITLILSNIPRIICFTMITFATDVWVIILAKFISGLSTGMILVASAVYVTEISSTKIRGSSASICHVLLSVGNLAMISGGAYLSYSIVNITTLVLIILFTIPLFFLPESPNLLFKKGKSEEALKILSYLRGSPQIAKSELIDYASNKDNQQITIKEVIKSKIIMKYLIVVIILSTGTQLSGMSVINMYLQTILNSTITNISSEVMATIISSVALIGTCCTIYTVDKFGRKPVCIVGLIGNVIGLVGLGTHFKLTESGESISGLLNYLPLASMIVAMFFFYSGMAPMYITISAELFDARVRGLAMSVCFFSAYLMTFILSKILLLLIQLISPAYVFLMFAAFTSFMLLFIIIVIPETKGKSFREIQEAMTKIKNKDLVNKI